MEVVVLNDEPIRNVEAEAGVVASVLLKPDLVYFSEELKPNYFTDKANAYIYYAVRALVERNVCEVDAYNIINILSMHAGTRQALGDYKDVLSPQALEDLFKTAHLIARREAADYKVLVKAVVDAAFRRSTLSKLRECERYCQSADTEDIEQKIYTTLDEVMLQFSESADLTQYKDVVEDIYQDIVSRQKGDNPSIEFPFPLLNQYVTMEPGEVVCFTSCAKGGKSAMLLSVTVDLLRKNKGVLVIDSEISTRLYTMRLLCHLANIRFADLRSGNYSADDEARLRDAVDWLKTRRFIHIYLPVFSEDAVYIAAKKAKHLLDIDVICVDYLKSTSEKDEAFATYAQMGRFTDLLKNRICGGLGIAGITAAQATSTGRIADSAKIARNVSTVVSITDKTPEELQRDGSACGNKKARVVFNRNGAQMTEDEYVDMQFDGSYVRWRQADAQHADISPF